MVNLNLPSYDFNVKNIDGRDNIFCAYRRKFVALTPEEWVRQNVCSYLTQTLGLSSALMAVEMQISLNSLSRRCDAVYYDSSMRPLIICEFKAPSVKITQKTFDQIFNYNRELDVPLLIVSNGLMHVCIDISQQTPQFFPIEQTALRIACIAHTSEQSGEM